jgi:hypothetical protein
MKRARKLPTHSWTDRATITLSNNRAYKKTIIDIPKIYGND